MKIFVKNAVKTISIIALVIITIIIIIFLFLNSFYGFNTIKNDDAKKIYKQLSRDVYGISISEIVKGIDIKEIDDMKLVKHWTSNDVPLHFSYFDKDDKKSVGLPSLYRISKKNYGEDHNNFSEIAFNKNEMEAIVYLERWHISDKGALYRFHLKKINNEWVYDDINLRPILRKCY